MVRNLGVDGTRMARMLGNYSLVAIQKRASLSGYSKRIPGASPGKLAELLVLRLGTTK